MFKNMFRQNKPAEEAAENSEVVSVKSGKSLGETGKKKINKMMGRIQSLTKSKQSGKHSETNNNNHNGKHCEESDDDEEADYLPAEETFMDCGLDDSISIKEADNKLACILPEEQCDIPTFLHTKNCDQGLIDETRKLLKERYAKNPDSFYDNDYNRMLTDDWTVSRFLLRRRLNPKRTAKLMEECGQFRRTYKMSEVQLWEFPVEFHKIGGLFGYAPDRVGNLTVYMRVKMYRRVPEISDVFKAWILCILEQQDVANNGRGVAVIFDLSGCGLQNVDLGFLSWLLSSFRNYCPKGVSYILVYNLPWILNATCKLAMTWMSASNRRALRFVHGDEIENFIAKENLPDYLGGECKIDYRAVPEGSKPAIEVCDKLDMTQEQALKIKEVFKEYLDENENGSDEDKSSLVTTKQQQIDAKSENDSKIFEDASENVTLNGTSTTELVTKASKFIT